MSLELYRNMPITNASSSKRKRLVPLSAIVAATIVVFVAFRVLFASERVYGLIIDAGSTGSRMHTFVFTRNSDKSLSLLKEDFYPITPGLSSYKDDIPSAGRSILPLLARSKRVVPRALYKRTPVFLRATAGLRILGEDVAEKILDEVREVLHESGFRFDHSDWAGVLNGNDEGVYSWITVNYLLGTTPNQTTGTLEMGGGSSQIAFVPSRPIEDSQCKVESESVTYKGATLSLYTYSHLGFGIKKAKADVMDRIYNSAKRDRNPCLSHGENEVEIPFKDDDGQKEIMVGAGSFAKCAQVIDDILMEGAGECECGFCTYRRKAQPEPIPEFVALAFYAERTVELGLKSPVSMRSIRELGERVCRMSVDEVRNEFSNVPNGDAVDLCFDLTFIYAHLSTGHGITEKKEDEVSVSMAKKIKGVELGWSLGAMFAEISKLENQPN